METPIPGSDLSEEALKKLNGKLPDFMKDMAGLKGQMSGIPDLLNKFKNAVGDKLKINREKEVMLKGKKVRLVEFGNGDVCIKWADAGEGKKFYDSIK